MPFSCGRCGPAGVTRRVTSVPGCRGCRSGRRPVPRPAALRAGAGSGGEGLADADLGRSRVTTDSGRRASVPGQNSGSLPAAGPRGRRRGGREGAAGWSAAWTAPATSCAVSGSMAMLRRSRTRRTTCPACRGASCGPAAMSALLEVVVHGGAVDAGGLGDLGDGVQPLAIRSGGGVHAADGGGLGGAQLGLAASGAAAGPGGLEALAGALDDQLALELVD